MADRHRPPQSAGLSAGRKPARCCRGAASSTCSERRGAPISSRPIAPARPRRAGPRGRAWRWRLARPPAARGRCPRCAPVRRGRCALRGAPGAAPTASWCQCVRRCQRRSLARRCLRRGCGGRPRASSRGAVTRKALDGASNAGLAAAPKAPAAPGSRRSRRVALRRHRPSAPPQAPPTTRGFRPRACAAAQPRDADPRAPRVAGGARVERST